MDINKYPDFASSLQAALTSSRLQLNSRQKTYLEENLTQDALTLFKKSRECHGNKQLSCVVQAMISIKSCEVVKFFKCVSKHNNDLFYCKKLEKNSANCLEQLTGEIPLLLLKITN